MGRLAIVEDEGPKVATSGNESPSEQPNSPAAASADRVRNHNNNNNTQKTEMKKGTARKAQQLGGGSQVDDKRKAGNNSDESGFYEEEEPPPPSASRPVSRDSIEIIYDKNEEDRRTKAASSASANDIRSNASNGAGVKMEERGEKSKNSYQNSHKGRTTILRRMQLISNTRKTIG